MASSGATPAAPSIALRPPGRRERDAVSASESVTFPELVWAHFLHQRALRESGELHGPAEDEFRQQLDRFVAEKGPDHQRLLVHAVRHRPSRSPRSRATSASGSGSCGAAGRTSASTRRPTGRRATRRRSAMRCTRPRPWRSASARSSRVRASGSQCNGCSRSAATLLSVVDGQREEGQPPGVDQGGEPRARRAGAGRVLLRPRGREDRPARLLLGNADRNPRAGAARCSRRAVATRSSGTTPSRDEAPRTFFVCYGMGAVGAIVSVMMRMAAKSATGFIDYEVGRPSLTPGRELPADHRRGLRGRHLLRPEERHHPAVDRNAARHDLLLRDLRLHRGVQRAQGDGHPGRSREDARRSADPPADDEPKPTSRRKADNGQRGGRSHLSVAGETAAPESVVPDTQPSGRDHARSSAASRRCSCRAAPAPATSGKRRSTTRPWSRSRRSSKTPTRKAPGDRSLARTSC